MDFWQTSQALILQAPGRYVHTRQTARIKKQTFVLGGVFAYQNHLLADVFSNDENALGVRMLHINAFALGDMAQKQPPYQSEAFWHTPAGPLSASQQAAAQQLGLQQSQAFFLQRFVFVLPEPAKTAVLKLECWSLLSPQTVLTGADQGQSLCFTNPYTHTTHTLFIKPDALALPAGAFKQENALQAFVLKPCGELDDFYRVTPPLQSGERLVFAKSKGEEPGWDVCLHKTVENLVFG